jgi:hypothetical protein
MLWVDEEETVAFPDIAYLELCGFNVELLASATEALDWFLANRERLEEYRAFVIDVQLPIGDDERFQREDISPGSFAGLTICRFLANHLDKPVWQAVRSRTLLYTQYPDTDRLSIIRNFAEAHDLRFVRKKGEESLMAKLKETGLL